MAIKLADTLAPMADFPAALAEHVEFSDGKSLQEKYDLGELGGEGGGGHIELTQAEYDALTDEEKLNGAIYFITDATGGGGDDSSHIELTQAEYDALTDEEKLNGAIYFITDATGGGGDDSSHIELTQAEYDALSDEEKDSDTIYFITDAEGGSSEVELTEYSYIIIEPAGSSSIYYSYEDLSTKIGCYVPVTTYNHKYGEWVVNIYVVRQNDEGNIEIINESGYETIISLMGVTTVTMPFVKDTRASSQTTWSSKQIASALLGDDQLNEFSNNSVQNWVLAGKFKEIESKLDEQGGVVTYTSLAELGLDNTATINDIIDAMKDGSQFTYKTDVFDYATEYNNIQYGTVTIYKQSTGRTQVLMTDKNTGNLYVGRMDTSNRIVGWRSETFHRVVAQATAGYFKFKPTNDGGFDQALRISVTDNYGGMINISGAKPSASQYKPFKCIRLSYGEYSNYDAIKLANNKMLKLFYYDGYFYLKVTTYTTCTFTGLVEAPIYVETFNETDAEEIPIRSVFDTPYNDGYADPSIICIGDADSSDGIIKTLSTLGFTEDVMTWDTGEYRISHVAGITNLPAEITEEKPGFRLAHYDVKKWGNNHNPHVSTYGCRQSVLHYKGNVFVRYTESGATAGVLITDTGWQKLAKVYTTLAELGLKADATVENVIKALPVGGKAIISTHEFTNYQTLFPYSVEADQYATLKVEKGYDAAGSRTIVAWVRKDASRIAYGGLDATNTVKWWNEVSINGIGAKTLVTNAQNFKLDITKKNANYFGFFKLTYLYGYHLCEICVGISSTIAYTVTKGKNLIDKITYTTNGANIVFGIDFTTKVYGVQVVEMPTDFGRINSLTAESFTGSTVANQTGLDLELYKQTKVVTSLDKGTWQVGQRIKQKTDFTATDTDVCFEMVAKNESTTSTGKYQKMTLYQLTPIENGTNASTSYSVFEDGKAQVSVWPATQNMPRNDYNIACEGYVNNGGAFNGQVVKSVTIDLSNSALQSTSSGLAAMSLASFISGSANVIRVEGYYIPPTGANTTLKKVIVRADIDNKLGGIIHTNNNWNFVVYGATNGSKGSGYAKIYYVD